MFLAKIDVGRRGDLARAYLAGNHLPSSSTHWSITANWLPQEFLSSTAEYMENKGEKCN